MTAFLTGFAMAAGVVAAILIVAFALTGIADRIEYRYGDKAAAVFIVGGFIVLVGIVGGIIGMEHAAP